VAFKGKKGKYAFGKKSGKRSWPFPKVEASKRGVERKKASGVRGGRIHEMMKKDRR